MARILIVEDDELLRDVGVSNLEILGHEALAAANGQQALDALAESQGEVDLVLLDLLMPVMDGATCLVHLREHYAHIPVIVCTGINDESKAAELCHAGARSVLGKPYRRQAMDDAINEVIAAT